MLFDAATQAIQQSLREQLKSRPGTSCVTKSLPKFSSARSDDCFQIDVSVGEIDRGQPEKRKSATGLEVNADQTSGVRCVGDEAAPMCA